MRDITVIMPCWLVNEELLALTRNAIESLGDVNLVIIDNGSPIGGGYLRSVADIYIRNKENLGYAKAVNQGIALRRTELFAVANNDIRVSPNWQQVAKGVFEENKKAYSVHFKMLDYDTPLSYGSSIKIGGKERWCTSSFFVVRSWNPLKYDENFLNSYDDWDYWKRVRDIGWQQAYTDKACYQHHHSYTQKLLPERESINKQNAEYFKKKHGGYAEELFERQFPEQIKLDYHRGFDL